MLETIWVVRHGQRFDWEHPEWTHTAERPWDTPLSAKGLSQAEETARFFASQQQQQRQPQRILTSPLIRATQTALATARQLPPAVRVCAEPGLTEWPIRAPLPLPQLCSAAFPAAPAQALARFDRAWTPLCADPRGERPNETIAEAHARGRALFAALLRRDFGDDVRCVALFGHAASCIAVVRAALGDELAPCAFPVCGVACLQRCAGGSAWSVVVGNGFGGSAEHLADGAEHTWSFELWRELERARRAKSPSV